MENHDLKTIDSDLKVKVYQMSWQKCMSFSKCSNVEAKNVTHCKLCYQRDKRSNYDFQHAKCQSEAFKVDLALLKIKLVEKFKLKIKLTETKI